MTWKHLTKGHGTHHPRVCRLRQEYLVEGQGPHLSQPGRLGVEVQCRVICQALKDGAYWPVHPGGLYCVNISLILLSSHTPHSHLVLTSSLQSR